MDQILREQPDITAGSGQGRYLESLPTEILVAILSACLTADLYALIRASPAIYAVFRQAKRNVLVSIVARDLGPALLDAVAATQIIPIESRSPKETARKIQQYEALRGDRRAAVSGLSANAVVKLVQVNRSVQFFIDEYAASRLPELHKIHPDSGAASALTTNERQRLALAMLRHQVIVRIESSHLPYDNKVIDKILGLFRPWETHQLVDAHSFVSEMQSLAFRHFQRSRMFGGLKTPSEVERDEALRDLGALHRKLVTERERHPVAGDPGVVSEARKIYNLNEVLVSAQFNWIISGPLPTKRWDDRVTEEQYWRDELYWREDAMPRLVPANNDDHDAATAPPFAWVDGHNGLDCQRWGNNVRRKMVPAGQEDTTGRQRIWMRGKLEKWRWLGFVFWDRARVELVKSQLPVYRTGWLTIAPPPDEECDFPPKAPSQPRRQRRVRRYVGI